ncbi:MAG: hypothetical protein KJZ93_24095 [Caldilineaceae bacterium]|nr:hypothetical protein [Caldilineaceae bacterium]
MASQRAGSLVIGFVLIGFGFLFLLFQLVPGLNQWARIDRIWPLLVVGVGVAFLIAAVAARIPPLAIPGAIVGGIGSLLFMQNLTGYWASWAFAWTLIPGFAGIGIILSGLLSGESTKALRAGGALVAVSALLFVIFAAFLGPFGVLSRFWPLLLILAGLYFLARNWLGTSRVSRATALTDKEIDETVEKRENPT